MEPGHRRVACLTMLRDEPFFFPIWYRHYASQFGAENLFMIDHCSQYPVTSPDGAPLNLLRLPFDAPSPESGPGNPLDGRRHWTITHMARALLTYYDVVIFSDVDELFSPDPAAYPSLAEFVQDVPLIGAGLGGIGIDLLHEPDEEGALDPTRPVLSQRRHFVYRPIHARPHILHGNCRVFPHGINAPWALDRDLMLVHLKYADAAELNARFLERQTISGDPIPDDGSPSAALRDLGIMLDRDFSPEELPHHTLLGPLMSNGAGPLLGAPDGPERLRGLDRGVVRLIDHIPQDILDVLRADRYMLPERFQAA